MFHLNKRVKGFLVGFISILIFSVSTLVLAKDACTTNDKQKIMYPTNYHFAKMWDKCGRKHLGSAAGTQECMQEEFPELSDPCAVCIGAMTACSKKECMFPCLINSRSQGCQECTRKNCRPALLECTGIAGEDLPQFAPKRD